MKQKMDIDEVFDDKESQEQVALMVQDYEKVFERIRKYTKSELCAWLVVQAWMEWQGKESRLVQREWGDDDPASEIQLFLLHALGVENLADLSRNEAQSVIDGLRKQGAEKREKELH